MEANQDWECGSAGTVFAQHAHAQHSEAGELEVQGYPQLHSKFEASQGYMRPGSKQKEERGNKEEGREGGKERK